MNKKDKERLKKGMLKAANDTFQAAFEGAAKYAAKEALANLESRYMDELLETMADEAVIEGMGDGESTAVNAIWDAAHSSGTEEQIKWLKNVLKNVHNAGACGGIDALFPDETKYADGRFMTNEALARAKAKLRVEKGA